MFAWTSSPFATTLTASSMDAVKKVVRIIPRGQIQDSRIESRRYWLARTPPERIEALKELRESTYRRLTRHNLPPILKVLRPFRLHR